MVATIVTILNFINISGIGVAVNIINYHLNVYYAVILAWSLRYFVASMSSALPWSTCDNEWNTENCFVFGSKTGAMNVTGIANKTTVENFTLAITTNVTAGGNGLSTGRISSVVEYWQ